MLSFTDDTARSKKFVSDPSPRFAHFLTGARERARSRCQPNFSFGRSVFLRNGWVGLSRVCTCTAPPIPLADCPDFQIRCCVFSIQPRRRIQFTDQPPSQAWSFGELRCKRPFVKHPQMLRHFVRANDSDRFRSSTTTCWGCEKCRVSSHF